MEVAGNMCAVCGRKVVFAQDGKYCLICRNVVHQSCDAQSDCPRCGRTYEIQRIPDPDPVREAVLPRSLRPASSAGPIAMLFVAAVLFLFLALMFVLLTHH
jgi:hypothetical protein